MILEIYTNSEVSIYEQLVRQIVIGISKKELLPGEELPSVRQLAADLGINLHTVNKAYQELKALGFLEIDRRVGTRVSENIEKLNEARKEYLQGELEFIVGELFSRGYDVDDLRDLINSVIEKVGGSDERL